MAAWTYMLASGRNGTIYLGATTDLAERTWQHRNDLVPSFTVRYGVHRLVWFEEHQDFHRALQREHTMKHWKRAWKIALIEATNPQWNDLYPEIAAWP